MTKQEWISNKIGILIREGRPQDQAAAIAYSMWERGDHRQEGGQLPTAQTGGFYGAFNPYFAQNPGMMNTEEYNKSKGYDPKTGYTGYVQSDANLSGAADTADKVDKFGQPTQGQPNQEYNDWVKYNIINPNQGGMDLGTSLAYTGQQFGQGNTGRGVMGAGLSALKGVRSFLSGYGAGKSQQDLERQMQDKLYNNDLYTRTDTYQGGGTTGDPALDTSFPIEEEYDRMYLNKYANQAEVDARLAQGAPAAPVTPSEQVVQQAEVQQAQKTTDTGKTFDTNSARDTWVKKTGLPWSEAKRLGYTDGTAKDNIKLLGELNDPQFRKEKLRNTPFTAPVAQAKAAQVQQKKAIQNFFDSPEYKALPKRQQEKAKAVIQKPTYDADSWGIDRITELLGNPGQTLAHIDRYGELPSQGFSMHDKKLADQTIGILNPAAWANSAMNAAKFADQGEYKKAAKEAVGALPGLGKLAKALMPTTELFPLLQGLPQAGTQGARAATQIGQGAQRLGQGAPRALLRQEGGEYSIGGEYDLTDEEIHLLLSQGYKLRDK